MAFDTKPLTDPASRNRDDSGSTEHGPQHEAPRAEPPFLGTARTAAPRAPLPARRSPLPVVPVLIGGLVLATGSYFAGKGAAPRPAQSPAALAAGAAGEPGQAAGDGPAKPETGSAAADGGVPVRLDDGARQTAGIKVLTAQLVAFGESLIVPGTVVVSPNRAAKVTPPVSGTVVALLAAPGDRVRAGQPLAVMDSPDVAQAHAAVRQAESAVAQARAQVQSAQAGVQQAQTKLGSAQSSLRRQRELAGTGAFAQPSLQAAQNELNSAQSELAQAQTESDAQAVIVQRNERLLKEQLIARSEYEGSQVGQKQAQTRAAQAHARLAIARQALEREQKVFAGGLLSKQAVEGAEAEARAAQGDVRQARKQEEAARTGLEGAADALAGARGSLSALEGGAHAEGGAGRIVLPAPMGGVVAQRAATVGQAVERSSDLFAIQDLQTVTVEAAVPEASVARVRTGAPVAVTVPAYPGRQFPGVVQGVGSDVDEKTRALPVRCLVRNPGGALKPGMFARVSLASGGISGGRAVAVPEAAVDEDGEDRFVYVETGTGSYAKRAVKTGRSAGGRVEVLAGVKPGEKVVTDGVFILKSESKKGELKGDD